MKKTLLFLSLFIQSMLDGRFPHLTREVIIMAP